MAIDVTGLTKRYREKVAVDDISFSVADGGVFAFVGTNGAGKSTTIGCLTTVLPFDAGEVRVRGLRRPSRRRARSRGDRRRLPGVPAGPSAHRPGEPPPSRAASRACRAASLEAKIARGRRSDRSRRVPRTGATESCPAASDDVSTSPVRCFTNRRCCSSTNRRPDSTRPVARSSGRTLHELSSGGDLTVFLTTHYLEETEEAARVCIIDDGRIIADDTPAEPAREAQPQRSHRDHG